MGFTIGNLTRLPLGRQGESNSRLIDIDMSEWMRDWPNATVDMLVQRPGEETYSPVKVKMQGGHLLWVPTRADVMIAGKGKAQIILTDVDDVEMRTRVVETIIGESMKGTEGEAPAPVQGWLYEVLQAANDIKQTFIEKGVPNPYKLKLTGAVEAEYDGSKEIVVKIPEAGGTSNEITILPETDLTRVEDDSSYLFVLPTPWENDVVAGNSYKVTYNGVVYALKATKASDLMPDAVPGMVVLGNHAIMGMVGGDEKVPFCLAAYPNAAGAEMGGYAALVSNDGAESVTLSVTEYASVAPAELPKITLTIDEEGNVTSDTPFAEASKMTCGELQSALKVVQTGNYAGQPAAMEADVQVRRRVTEAMGEMLEITFRQFADPSDYAAAKEVTRYIYWAEQAIQLAPIVLTSLPVMNNWGFDQQTYYLRSVGGVWQPVTIDQLKADLGLTGGETVTTDIFYTADGKVFTTVDGAVMHVQKGDQ